MCHIVKPASNEAKKCKCQKLVEIFFSLKYFEVLLNDTHFEQYVYHLKAFDAGHLKMIIFKISNRKRCTWQI
jgi:hypothetical protein